MTYIVKQALVLARRKVEEEVRSLKFTIDLHQTQLDSAVDRRGTALRELHELQVALGEKAATVITPLKAPVRPTTPCTSRDCGTCPPSDITSYEPEYGPGVSNC